MPVPQPYCEVVNDQAWKGLPADLDCGILRQCFEAGDGIDITNGVISWTGSLDPVTCEQVLTCLSEGNGIQIGVDGEISLLDGTNGDLLFHNGAGWLPLPIGLAGRVLTVVAGQPSWQPIPTVSFNITDGSTTEIVNQGDTITFASGRNMLETVTPTDTVTYSFFAGTVQGQILYWNQAGSVWVTLDPGTTGQVLTVNGSATAPEWQTPSSVLQDRRHELANPAIGTSVFALPNPPTVASARLEVYINGLLQSITASHYTYNAGTGEVTLTDLISEANTVLTFLYRS